MNTHTVSFNYLRFVLQKTCRPFFCPIGEVLGGCDCLSFVDKISDMPILLKLIVRPSDGNTLPTSETTILKLGAALQKAIQKSYTKINVKVFAMFKQEFMMKQYYVYTAIANTIKDYGVKESFRSLAQVLDGPPFLQISQGKLNYNIELTNHVEVWFESGYDADKLYIVIRARELTTQRELTRICNSYTMGCPPVRGDNPRALASGLSYVQVDKHGITILCHLHQCRPCTSRDISC